MSPGKVESSMVDGWYTNAIELLLLQLAKAVVVDDEEEDVLYERLLAYSKWVVSSKSVTEKWIKNQTKWKSQIKRKSDFKMNLNVW